MTMRQARRHRRADATRRQALSPARILLSVLLVPVVAGGLTVSLFIRTSPFEREDALRHLIAMAGCSAAAKVGVAGAARGEPGYHSRNDTDRDGVACNVTEPGFKTVDAAAPGMSAPRSSGAKFIRP